MQLQGLRERKMNKRGQLITGTTMGIVMFVVMVIIGLVLVTTVRDANLLTSGSVEKNLTDDMVTNLTQGLREVSNKIVTVLTILAVVFLFGALVLLVALGKRMQSGNSAI